MNIQLTSSRQSSPALKPANAAAQPAGNGAGSVALWATPSVMVPASSSFGNRAAPNGLAHFLGKNGNSLA